MIDEHIVHEGWGIQPTLGTIAGYDIPSYSLFVLLALVVGGLVYWWEARKQKAMSENTFYIAFAALVGGALGAKIPIWIISWISPSPPTASAMAKSTSTSPVPSISLSVFWN